MKLRSISLRVGACLLLFFVDRALATLAIETNAAGALLSPSSELSLDALVVAALFLGCRLLLAVTFCGAVGWTASDAVLALSSRVPGLSADPERSP